MAGAWACAAVGADTSASCRPAMAHSGSGAALDFENMTILASNADGMTLSETVVEAHAPPHQGTVPRGQSRTRARAAPVRGGKVWEVDPARQ